MKIAEIVADIKIRSQEEDEVQSVYFIACGGSLAGLYAAKYLLEKESEKFLVGYYNASEFLQNTPKVFGKNSIAICCTLRGTPETEEALAYCKEKGAYTVAMIGEGNNKMEEIADYVISFKTVADVNTPMMETNISEALLFSFELLHQYESYSYYKEAIVGFNMLESIAEKIRKYVNNKRTETFAQLMKDEDVIYVLAGAPSMGVAYAFSICSLMEIQWIHSPTVNSAEFFHGPFETLDKNLAVLHLISDGRSRPEDLRADSFLKKFGEKVISIDAKELYIDQIDDHVKEYFNHPLFDVALREYLTVLAKVRNHPKEVRRYMWKMEY